MERTPVASSNIASVGHDPETNTLEVEFKNGGVYQYEGVSADEHGALASADSIGSHFHKNIKSRYQGVKQ